MRIISIPSGAYKVPVKPSASTERWVLPAGGGGRRPRGAGAASSPDGYPRCPADLARRVAAGPARQWSGHWPAGGRGQGSVGSGGRGHSQEAHLHPYIFVLCSSRSFSSPEENEKEDGPLRPPEVAGWVTARPLPSPAATTGSRVPLNCQFRLLSSARSRVQRLSALGPRSHTSPRPLPGEGPPASSPRPPLHAGTRAGDPRDIGASTLHPPGVASAAGQGGGHLRPRRPLHPGRGCSADRPALGSAPRAPPPPYLPEKAPRERRAAGGANAGIRSGCAAAGERGRRGAGGRGGRGSPALGASARSGRARCAQRGGREAGRGRREPGGLCSLRPPPGPAAALAPPRAPRRPPGSAPGLGGAACPPRSASGCPAAPALAGLRSPPPSAAARGGRSRSPASLLPTLSRAETAPLLCSSCSSDPPLRVLPPRALLTA